MKNSGTSSSDPKGKRPMSHDQLENLEEMPSESTIDDFCQYWLLHNTLPTSQLEFPNENVSASFPNPFDAVHYETSLSTPIEPLNQNWFLNTPAPSFQPVPTFQSIPTFQPIPSFQPEPSEGNNRVLSKRPMVDSPIQFANHVDEVQQWVPTSNTNETIDPSILYGPEFDKLVEDSWAYISKLYNRKKKSAKASSSKTHRSVRSKRSYQFVERNTTLVVFGEEMDISWMPKPVYSCTGIPRNCCLWGGDGWTSNCCTTTLSMYPLPTYKGARRIVRLAGRKMGCDTFTKVIEELLLAGYDLECPIDLKDHWTKHGTNKFAVNRKF